MRQAKKVLRSLVGIALCFVMVAAWFDMPMEVKAADYPGRPSSSDSFYHSGSPLNPGEIREFGSRTFSSAEWSRNATIYYLVFAGATYDTAFLLHWDADNGYWETSGHSCDLTGGDTLDGFLSSYAERDEDTIEDLVFSHYAIFWGSAPGASGSSAAHTHTWVYGTIYDATEDTDGLEGEHCECGACRNTTPIPSGDVIIQNNYRLIDWSYPGHTTTLNMKTMCNLSQAFMKRLASKNNCDFVIKLVWNNKPYEFYVPAGTQFDTSLEYYGVAKLMEMFEYKQL